MYELGDHSSALFPAGVRRFDYLVQAVRRAGAKKLIFGSDGPWLHPGLELHKIKLLGLPAREEALILGGNASRLIFSRTPRVGHRRRSTGSVMQFTRH